MGRLVVFVDVMRIHIVRVIEVTLGEGLGDYTSCGCKIVEKCSDDREIKDKLITFCGFSRNMTAGEERIRLMNIICSKRSGLYPQAIVTIGADAPVATNICAAADLGFYEII